MRRANPVVPVLLSLALMAPVVQAAPRGSPPEISRALGALAKEPGNPRLLTDAGSQFALRASDQGYPSDIEDARKYLRQAAKMDPKSAQTVAWMGCLRCIEAKVRQSKGYVREGLSQMDRAVEMDPNDLLVRLVRGSVEVEVPKEFSRNDQGITDLEVLKTAHDRDPQTLSQLRIDPTEVYLKLGKGYRAKGNMDMARAMWVRAAEGPPGKDRETANRLLEKFGRPAKTASAK